MATPRKIYRAIDNSNDQQSLAATREWIVRLKSQLAEAQERERMLVKKLGK